MELIFQIVKPIFFHFLKKQSTAASRNSSFFNQNIFFSQSFILAGGNKFFDHWKQYCFSLTFFCKEKLLLKLGEGKFLKTKYIPASEHPLFDIFRDFFKVQATFPYSGNALSTNPSSGQWKRIFCLVEHFFLDFSEKSASDFFSRRKKSCK